MAQITDTTNAPTVKPEVGKRYRTRDGREVLITLFFDASTYPFWGSIGCLLRTWTEHGTYHTDEKSDLDLIEEITDESEQPEIIDLTDNKIPFGLLSEAEKGHLRNWPHGVEVYVGSGWDETCGPFWNTLSVYRTIPAPERVEWFAVTDRDKGGAVTAEYTVVDAWQEVYGGTIYRITTDPDGSNPEIEVVE